MRKRHTNPKNMGLKANRSKTRKNLEPLVYEDWSPFFDELFRKSGFEFRTDLDANDYAKYQKEMEQAVKKGCIGCLVELIFITAIICLVLYGFGWLGFQIIHMISDFFKAIVA